MKKKTALKPLGVRPLVNAGSRFGEHLADAFSGDLFVWEILETALEFPDVREIRKLVEGFEEDWAGLRLKPRTEKEEKIFLRRSSLA